MKKIQILLLFLTFALEVSAQLSTIDSLKNELANPGLSTDHKLELLKRLSQQDFPDGISKNIQYTEKLLALAKESNNYKYAGDALDFLISIHNQKGDFTKSVELATEAIKLANENNELSDVVYFSNQCGGANNNAANYYDALENYSYAQKLAHENKWFISESSILNNMGGIYYILGDEIQAMDYFIQSLNIKEALKETKHLAGALINVGGIYNILGDHLEGLEFLKRGYENAIENKDAYFQAKALISIGDTYINLETYDDAMRQYDKALRITDTIGEDQMKANILGKIGATYLQKDMKDEALKYYQKSLDFSDSIQYQYGISVAAQEIGALYTEQKKYKTALGFLLRAESVSREINANTNLLDDYKSLSNIYKKLGQPEKALDYFTKYATFKDSLIKLENHEKFSAIKTLYELDKKQSELDHLKLENEITGLEAKQSKYLLMGSIGLIAVIILVVILIFRQHKVRGLQKTIHLEQKLLRSQINPHFIFNALTAVQRFIFEKSTMMASDYLGSFSRLIRFILNSSTVDKIALSEEIGFLKNYLELQAIRFDNKFDFEIKIDKNIESESTFIPPMLVQPIIENAVEHGIRHLEGNGHIKIIYKRTNNLLNVSIEDNGIGRKKSAEINAGKTKKDKSLSTSITNERLLHLNKGFGENIQMEIKDLYNDKGEAKGTKVVLNIPMNVK
ncbi:MAG: tetratricopeptide repeat protein [Chlorobi bacterium]|nr:tetratricopeptide repeat protein [Chlorobiota bacterium]